MSSEWEARAAVERERRACVRAATLIDAEYPWPAFNAALDAYRTAIEARVRAGMKVKCCQKQ